MPLGVCRSSGSRVRLPTRTTRLMLAMLLLLLFLLRTRVRSSVLRLPAGGLLRDRRRLRPGAAGAVAPLDPARRQVAHDAVGDLEDARQLVDCLGLVIELQQVVDPVVLLLDRVGQPAPAPRIVSHPRSAAVLDQLAGADDDLLLPFLGQVWIEHEQDLVSITQPIPPSVWSAPPGLRCG